MRKHILLASLSAVLLALMPFAPLEFVHASEAGELHLSSISGISLVVTYEELLNMPKTIVSADLFCFGVMLTGGNWGGVNLEFLLNKVGIDTQALSVEFTAGDGYKVTIPLDRAIQPDVIIAYEKDNLPLSETLRLVVPEANGSVWIALVTSISLSSSPSQIEGQYVSAGVTPLQGLPSSLLRGVENSTQLRDAPAKPVDPSNSPENKTIEPQLSSSSTEEQPSQKQTTSGIQSKSLGARIESGIAIALVSIMLAAACLSYRRRNIAGT